MKHSSQVPDMVPASYPKLLEEIKQKTTKARIRASIAVNRELVELYWSVGRLIVERQKAEGWGTKVIERLSEDLRRAFPEMAGFSVRNLKYMRSLTEAYPDRDFVQQAVAGQSEGGISAKAGDRNAETSRLRMQGFGAWVAMLQQPGNGLHG